MNSKRGETQTGDANRGKAPVNKKQKREQDPPKAVNSQKMVRAMAKPPSTLAVAPVSSSSSSEDRTIPTQIENKIQELINSEVDYDSDIKCWSEELAELDIEIRGIKPTSRYVVQSIFEIKGKGNSEIRPKYIDGTAYKKAKLEDKGSLKRKIREAEEKKKAQTGRPDPKLLEALRKVKAEIQQNGRARVQAAYRKKLEAAKSDARKYRASPDINAPALHSQAVAERNFLSSIVNMF